MTHYQKLATMSVRIICIVLAGGCLSYGITVCVFYLFSATFFALSVTLLVFNLLPVFLVAGLAYVFAPKIAKVICAGLED